MEIKNRRFELRLTEQELEALDKLTKKAGYKHRAEWVAASIKMAAKRKKVWK